jgi:thioester reductase-like protein
LNVSGFLNEQFHSKRNFGGGLMINKLAATGLTDFLNRLNLQVTLEPLLHTQTEMVSYLTKTLSDFNFAAQERSPQEIGEFLTDEAHSIYGVRVTDQFGDYGTAGAVLITISQQQLEVNDMLLNCRVLGKNVEHLVLQQLLQIAGQNSCQEITVSYLPTTQNTVAGKFLARLFDRNTNIIDPKIKYQSLITLVSDKLQKAADARNEFATRKPSDWKEGISAQLFNPYQLIGEKWRRKNGSRKAEIINQANKKRTAEELLLEVQVSKRRARANFSVVYVAPRTELEKQIADLWQEMLGINKVGVLDNFFSIGGNSILATQLLIRFDKFFKVQLPVRIFFENSTVEKLAKYVAALQKEENREKFEDGAVSDFRFLTRDFLKSEVWLDESITVNGLQPPPNIKDVSKVLLTGATGFFGAYLLKDILEETRFTVYCLVRAETPGMAVEKIKANLKTYFLWKEEYAKRIVPILGDLAKPYLGINLKEFGELAEEIELIYHSGAITTFIEPYKLIKDVNVQGTQEIIRLAATKRLKPVHFVSTHYVFSQLSHAPGEIIYEDQIPKDTEIMGVGYRLSKWVAEHLVDIARSRGIPAAIYRPGRIAGDSKIGACQTKDLGWLMVRACLEAGAVFEDNIKLEFIPIDYVSQALLHLSLQPASLGRNFHLVNHNTVRMAEIIEWFSEFNYTITKCSYAQWRAKLIEYSTDHPRSTVSLILPFLPDSMPEWDSSLIFDDSNTREGLVGTEIHCPVVDERVFKNYIRYFMSTKFLA